MCMHSSVLASNILFIDQRDHSFKPAVAVLPESLWCIVANANMRIRWVSDGEMGEGQTVRAFKSVN